MPDERTPHFVVPPNLVRSVRIPVRGRSRPVVRPSYSAHGDYLRERTAAFREASATRADADATDAVFLQVKTPPSHPLDKERDRLQRAGFRIVALSPIDPSTGTASIRKAEMGQLERKLTAYATTPSHRGRSYLSVIEDIQPVPPEEKVAAEIAQADDHPTDCLLLFYSTLTEAEQARVLLAVRSFMARINAHLGQTRRLANGVLAVEARLGRTQAFLAGQSFTTLRSVRPDSVYFAPDSWRLSPIPGVIPVDAPAGRTAVAVFDTGIDPATRELQGCVQGVIPCLPSGAVAPRPDHGTFVASRIAYGDSLRGQLAAGRLTPMTPLLDVPIFGVDSQGRELPPHEGDLAFAVDTVVARAPANVRVLNLSVGCEAPIQDDSVSLVASVLDHHTRHSDILVVTTAGNVRDHRLLGAFPDSHLREECRIDAPGDSLGALTVGSIAHHDGDQCLSRPRELSAFSRRGPGPYGTIKPDIVAHGGNCRADGTTTDHAGVHGLLNAGRGWAVDFGTSFAAPLVASMAASLMDHYEHPPANLIKALLTHFTKPAVAPPVAILPHYLVGRGEPDLALAMWATPHSATFLCTGELGPTRFTFVPFHVPPCLAADSGARLRIRATVVINPAVAPDNPLEYSCCRLTLGLRKPAQLGYVNVSGVDSSPDPGKWSPTECITKAFTHSYTTGRWELQIRLWTRNLPDDYNQPYAAVIQVLDERGRAPVLGEVQRVAGTEFAPARVATAA
jgi:hypothetical protein